MKFNPRDRVKFEFETTIHFEHDSNDEACGTAYINGIDGGATWVPLGSLTKLPPAEPEGDGVIIVVEYERCTVAFQGGNDSWRRTGDEYPYAWEYVAGEAKSIRVVDEGRK